MFNFGCKCKEELAAVKKDLADFKAYVNIPRLENWIKLLKGYTEMFAPKPEEKDLEKRVAYLENKMKNLLQKLRAKKVINSRGRPSQIELEKKDK